MTLSHISIRTRKRLSAGVIIIRAGDGHPRNFFEKKSHNTENCAENTLFHILKHALTILIH